MNFQNVRCFWTSRKIFHAMSTSPFSIASNVCTCSPTPPRYAFPIDCKLRRMTFKRSIQIFLSDVIESIFSLKKLFPPSNIVKFTFSFIFWVINFHFHGTAVIFLGAKTLAFIVNSKTGFIGIFNEKLKFWNLRLTSARAWTWELKLRLPNKI